MAQVGNNEESFASGEYMIQDRDHMGETNPVSHGARRPARQAEQSQTRTRQHGNSDDHASGQQGGERQRKSR